MRVVERGDDQPLYSSPTFSKNRYRFRHSRTTPTKRNRIFHVTISRSCLMSSSISFTFHFHSVFLFLLSSSSFLLHSDILCFLWIGRFRQRCAGARLNATIPHPFLFSPLPHDDRFLGHFSFHRWRVCCGGAYPVILFYPPPLHTTYNIAPVRT